MFSNTVDSHKIPPSNVDCFPGCPLCLFLPSCPNPLGMLDTSFILYSSALKKGHILRSLHVKENHSVLEEIQAYLLYSLQGDCYHDLFLGTKSASVNFTVFPPRGPVINF